jgi:hypothetical protein
MTRPAHRAWLFKHSDQMTIAGNSNYLFPSEESSTGYQRTLCERASLPSIRDYERSDPIGMMHMNRSDISELGVRKRR